MSNLLRAEGVSYQVNGRSILSDIDLSFETGSNTTIVGPSGSGKSTFLKILSSLLSPTEGEIFYQEAPITTMPIETYRQKVSYCFQQPTLFGETVYDNLLFPFTVRQEAFNQEKVVALLQQVKLPAAYLEKKIAELSGGERQRVALLRNIIFVPDVLLLDEPLSNLDARLRLQTREEIRRIQKETGITTVFVTHDQEEAMSICDIIVLMKDGVIQQIGGPQEVYDNPCNLFVSKFLGTPAINVFDAYVKDHKVYIGDDYIFDKDIEDGELIVAIRPEGMILDDNGNLTCDFIRREVMGKDHSIVCKNKYCGANIRAIVSGDTFVVDDREKIKFSLKQDKVYVFDKRSEKRL